MKITGLNIQKCAATLVQRHTVGALYAQNLQLLAKGNCDPVGLRRRPLEHIDLRLSRVGENRVWARRNERNVVRCETAKRHTYTNKITVSQTN